jgi:MYXO-CTERM domain-containing protein
MNIWVSASTWRAFPRGTTPVAGGVVGVGTAATDLAVNTPIGPASTFLTPATTASPVGSAVIIGVRIQNELTGNTRHFGWVRMNLTNPATAAGTIIDYAWENTPDTAIGAGVVPTPGAAGLLAVAGLAGIRRRR